MDDKQLRLREACERGDLVVVQELVENEVVGFLMVRKAFFPRSAGKFKQKEWSRALSHESAKVVVA